MDLEESCPVLLFSTELPCSRLGSVISRKNKLEGVLLCIPGLVLGDQRRLHGGWIIESG